MIEPSLNGDQNLDHVRGWGRGEELGGRGHSYVLRSPMCTVVPPAVWENGRTVTI